VKDETTRTLESVSADAAETPAAEPLRVLRASEIRARRRPRAVAFVWLWELVAAVVVATPVQAWARAIWGRHPDGDAPIFRAGGQDLVAWVLDRGLALSIVLRTTLLLLFVLALVAPLVTGALGASLVTAQSRRAPSAMSSLRLGLAAYWALLVVGALATACEGLVLGIGVIASSLVDHRLVNALGDAHSFLVRLAVLAVFFAGVLVLGVVADLVRVAVIRAVALDPEATTLTHLRRALAGAVATARRSLGRATLGWAWRAILASALVVVGGLLGDAVGGRGGAVLVALFAAHQILIFGRAALRASWLANALRLL